eukprot:g72068.t1
MWVSLFAVIYRVIDEEAHKKHVYREAQHIIGRGSSQKTYAHALFAFCRPDFLKMNILCRVLFTTKRAADDAL